MQTDTTPARALCGTTRAGCAPICLLFRLRNRTTTPRHTVREGWGRSTPNSGHIWLLHCTHIWLLRTGLIRAAATPRFICRIRSVLSSPPLLRASPIGWQRGIAVECVPSPAGGIAAPGGTGRRKHRWLVGRGHPLGLGALAPGVVARRLVALAVATIYSSFVKICA